MKLSIIIPVYNIEHNLEMCFQSLIRQDSQDVEIIVINDGSTDNSLDIIKQYAHLLPLRVINQSNQGVSIARNRGIVEATADYLLFLDGDDYLKPNILNKIFQVIENNMSDVYIFNYDKSNEHHEVIKDIHKSNISKNFFISDKLDLYSKLYINKKISIWTGCLIISRNYILNNHLLFNNKFICGEDLNFFLKCLFLSENIYCSCLYISNYYTRSNSVTNSYNLDKLSAYLAIKDLGCFFEKKGFPQEIIKYFKYDYPLNIYIFNYIRLLQNSNDNIFSSSLLMKKELKTSEITYQIKKIKLSDISSIKLKIKFIVFKISPIFLSQIYRYFKID